jgi:hypothetical protein
MVNNGVTQMLLFRLWVAFAFVVMGFSPRLGSIALRKALGLANRRKAYAARAHTLAALSYLRRAA